MASLYADENFPYPAVVALRQLGHDVLTAHEAGQANQGIPDVEVLAFAVSKARAVITSNRIHFIRLHRQKKAHHGIVVCTRDDAYSALAARIDQALAKVPDLTDQLIRIVRPAKP
ncbi:MAG: DUF5615 family PIN-like protein [Gemmataceae bacterium]|nr:DUF5615 family PIN-like protein [Gemmataceae bacterium]